MTDNQDSGVALDKQVPPTDRPLTAGDVLLLREGDVLRVVDPHPNTHAIGDLVTLVRTLPISSTEEWVRIVWDGNEVDQYPHRFTFASRPATSAASEGEGVGQAVGHLTARLNKPGAFRIDDEPHLRTVLAALASPPVSERERELEGALREIEAMCPATCETSLAHDMAQIASEALTAQPAGEGK